MENEVTAHRAGTIVDVAVSAGEPVTTGQPICTIEPDD
jgi:biotin carboxyl carrier protein